MSRLASLLVTVTASVLGAVALLAVVNPAGAQDDAPPTVPPVDEPGDVNELDLLANGEQLYNTSCVSCHGAGGVGSSDGPDITEVGELGADFMLRTGRMPLADSAPQAPSKPPAYTDSEIKALVAYVGSLGDGPAIPEVDIENADLVNGGELYRANCQACHNASGIGGALSYGKHAPALTSVEPTQVVEAMRFGPSEMPIFGDDIFPASDADDIARYVDYLHEPEDPGGFGLGHSGPAAEGFVAWLVGIGAALWIIRWITSESGPRLRPRSIEQVTETAEDRREAAADAGAGGDG